MEYRPVDGAENAATIRRRDDQGNVRPAETGVQVRPGLPVVRGHLQPAAPVGEQERPGLIPDDHTDAGDEE
jgi:hypothetical protein